MSERPVNGNGKLPHERIHAEMLDSFDEEMELEIDDDRLDALTNEFEPAGPRAQSGLSPRPGAAGDVRAGAVLSLVVSLRQPSKRHPSPFPAAGASLTNNLSHHSM
jgi:hypothetical protein